MIRIGVWGYEYRFRHWNLGSDMGIKILIQTGIDIGIDIVITIEIGLNIENYTKVSISFGWLVVWSLDVQDKYVLFTIHAK